MSISIKVLVSVAHVAMRHVHDLVTQVEEPLSIKRFSEEVGQVVRRVDEGDHESLLLHELADVELAKGAKGHLSPDR